ncbi:hypothetical protein Tco_1472483, partial [Tanacetum coccineum]
MGIHDFLCLLDWTGSEVQEEPHHDIRPTLQRLPFYCTPPAAADTVISDPSPTDLAGGNPSAKVLAKAEASQIDYDNDDACVEIPLVTPFRSVTVIPYLGNQGRGSVAPATEGSNTRDSQGKGIIVDDAATPSAGASQPRPSSGHAPSFRDVSGDAIHTDFFSF